MNMQENTLKAIFSVNAVAFGTDESILGLNLCDGFSFQRKSLMPLKDHLDEVFETDAMGLRREYELARFDDSLDVICITKHTELDIPISKAYDYFTKMADESLLSLDNQIRAIRLVIETPLRCKKIMFRLVQDKNTYEHLFSVNESMTTHEISRFHCEENEFDALSEAIRKISFPLSDKILNIAHMHYDLSYHQNRYISVTLLVAVLEMLYLNDEGAKKERLSKRCAIFLMENNCDIMHTYNRLKQIYKKRSEFVHEGTFYDITDDDILFLRRCVRESILKLINDNRTKQERIANIRSMVESFQEWPNE